MRAGIIFLLSLLFTTSASAYQQCFKQAAERYSIPLALLYAIAKVESNFDPNAVNRNTNKTSDHGLMQINSSWFDKLEKRYGIRRENVINDPCTNVEVGAWILASNFQSKGRKWDAVGAYNAGFSERNKSIRSKYANKVKHYYEFYQAQLHSKP